ncbi:endolytic transglycosylase MltG [Rhodocyclus tenuis]|uniref:endolytic transglycosylase MltG n=1 Tax=Rhodocyclus gracilis TaxID=2929842 RepID=UPI001298C143|nr:endolytic transglycosylase MltG [Rhodocyclus gracilis]MRD72813.1 endolytic transglycosylase MltG [Rhodocyclus gracilis]
MLKTLRNLIFLAVLLAVAAGGGFYLWVSSPLNLVRSPLEFDIEPGSSLRSVARQLNEAGIAIDPRVFVLLGKLSSAETSLKAGSYVIESGSTARDLLAKLTRGDVTQSDLAFIEGWTFRQMRDRLDAHPDLRHDARGLSDAELLRRIGAPESAAEGLFFPDTYTFARRSSDIDVLARAYRTMQRRLAREWEGRASGLPYRSPYEALIMASIVEKETGRDSDRPLISAVFVNRLRQGMPLQTDPTVIYGLGDRFDGNLRRRDLTSDTPFNTYTRSGLPPTPIALPGLAALHATLHPANSRALYFVARGDGSSVFSETLDAHNTAVARYQKGKTR